MLPAVYLEAQHRPRTQSLFLAMLRRRGQKKHETSKKGHTTFLPDLYNSLPSALPLTPTPTPSTCFSLLLIKKTSAGAFEGRHGLRGLAGRGKERLEQKAVEDSHLPPVACYFLPIHPVGCGQRIRQCLGSSGKTAPIQNTMGGHTRKSWATGC